MPYNLLLLNYQNENTNNHHDYHLKIEY
ncbi:unnamed protein product [Chironomus riparius]|uniref:Uncharacterized protein n=1 Tax=Chironomus riparius TaxID=315576 RepID=A0A9N9WSD5_9DIPT|nr:unnamed protein product [Chironomus riparius]